MDITLINTLQRQGWRLKDLLDRESLKQFVRENYPKQYRPTGVELEFNSSIERYEVEDLFEKAGLRNWRVTTDCTAYVNGKYKPKNWESAFGLEINSAIIFNLDLKTVGQILQEKDDQDNYVFQYGPKTGFHCHVDHTNLNEHQINQLNALFFYLQPKFKDMVPAYRYDDRAYNQCIPNTTTMRRGLWMAKSRYSTIEYRFMPSTRNMWTVKMWVFTLNRLHMYIKKRIKSKQDIISPYVNFFDVLENPILIDFYNAKKIYYLTKAKLDKKAGKGNIAKQISLKKEKVILMKNRKIEKWIAQLITDFTFVVMRDKRTKKALGASYSVDGLRWITLPDGTLPFYKNAKLRHVKVDGMWHPTIVGDTSRSKTIIIEKFKPRDHIYRGRIISHLQSSEYFWTNKCMKMLYLPKGEEHNRVDYKKIYSSN